MSTPLTPLERRVFKAVAETVAGAAEVSDDGGPSVADAADVFVREMPPGDRRLLGLLLKSLEYGTPSALVRLARFSDLDPLRRERVLRRWANSPITMRRQGAAALKALGVLAFYARESAWGEVGYDGPWLDRVDVPVHPAPELRAPPPGPAGPKPGVTSSRDLSGATRLTAQVCVIGTGAGGAALAARLAEAGADVVAVEAGGLFTAADATQRELDMLPRLFREGGLRATHDKGVSILQGTGVGGSTLHNTGLVWSPPAGILDRWRAEHAFPYDDATFQPYVDEARATLRAKPIPESEINANNGALRRGADGLGWGYTIADHNRDECSACGYCILGCAYNRKHNASLTWIPRAIAAGARVICDAPVDRIEGTAGSRRVVCRDGRGGELTVEAPVVVLAAGAIDTPGLLLRSGLGNNRVGVGLRLHPSAMVQAEMPDQVRGWRGLPQSVVVEEFADFRDDGRGGFLFIPLALWPGTMAASTTGLGAAHRAIMERFADLATCGVMVHDETEGRVTLSGAARPVARYWPNEDDRAEMRRGIGQLARALLAAGAERVHLPYNGAGPVTGERTLKLELEDARDDVHRLPLGSVHPQGSCPLGGVQATAACDPYGELWGERGVFVADTSIFPTSVGVPPQVTTMALAMAVADHIARERI